MSFVLNLNQEKQECPDFRTLLFEISRTIPQLHLGERTGLTGYIDFIKVDELPQKSFMGGTDCYGRPFIVFKVIMDGEMVMETIFQRYNDDKELWMSCGHATKTHLLESYGGMRKVQMEFYVNLLVNGKAVLSEEHRPCRNKWVGKTAKLASMAE